MKFSINAIPFLVVGLILASILVVGMVVSIANNRLIRDLSTETVSLKTDVADLWAQANNLETDVVALASVAQNI